MLQNKDCFAKKFRLVFVKILGKKLYIRELDFEFYNSENTVGYSNFASIPYRTAQHSFLFSILFINF